MNKIFLVGRWTKDCELKFVPSSGTAILKGTIAVDRQYKKEGEPTADFFNVTCWGKKAEATANHCGAKGNLLAISGWVRTGHHESKKNPGVTMPSFEVEAEDIKFLTYKKENGSADEEMDMVEESYDGSPF